MGNGSSDLHNLRHHQVQDADLVLRRFMPFNRFRQIIETSTLYFPPASKFEDDLEGHPTHRDQRDRESKFRTWGYGKRELDTAMEANQAVIIINRQAVVISCWTQNGTDHARMWADYTGCDEAVAIESTVGRIRHSLGDDFLIIPVRYLDFDREKIPREHAVVPFFHKRAELFEWENEVRIIGYMEFGALVDSPRIVQVDLASLIQKITVAPTAPDHFMDVVQTLTQNSLPHVPIESP